MVFNKASNRQQQHQQQQHQQQQQITTASSSLLFLLLFASFIITPIAVVDGFIIPPSSSSSSNKFSSSPAFGSNKAIVKTKTKTTSSSSSSSSALFGQLSWSGDSRASMEWKNEPIELVQEFLQSSESDVSVMGSNVEAKLICSDNNIYDTKQPQIQFLNLNLIPIFVNQIQRTPPEYVVVRITDAKTQLAPADKSSSSNSMANRAVASILEKSKFVGKSRIRATTTSSSSRSSSETTSSTTTTASTASTTSTTTSTTTTIVTVDLDLTLQVPLPKFVLLPPGFNTIGSQIIKQTGKSRTKKLLINLQQDYHKWVSLRRTTTKTKTNNNNNNNKDNNKEKQQQQ